jgi:hypothetical protein
MQRPRFDDEFRDLSKVAYRVAFRIIGDRSTAEDIAQECLARAYEHWTRISEYRQAWVARVAGNLAIDHLRKRRPSQTARTHGDLEVLMIERIDLQRALLGLPKRQREKKGVLQPGILATLYDTYQNDIVVDSELTIDKMIEFAGVIRNLQPADIASYQIEATAAQISRTDVLVPQIDTDSMQAVLDIFRGTALLVAAPATVTPTAVDPPPNAPPTAIVPERLTDCA